MLAPSAGFHMAWLRWRMVQRRAGMVKSGRALYLQKQLFHSRGGFTWLISAYR
jgi:hypothetical protein